MATEKTGNTGSGLILSEVLGIVAQLQHNNLMSEIRYVRRGFCYFDVQQGSDFEWQLSKNGEPFATLVPISASCKIDRKLSYEDSLSSQVASFNFLVKSQTPVAPGLTVRLKIRGGYLFCRVFSTRFDDFMTTLLPATENKYKYYRMRVIRFEDD